MATTPRPLPTPFLAALHLNLETVEAGVPLDAVSDFAVSSGIPLKELHEIVIPARTLKHRRARQEPLSRDESDKLTRVARIFDHAVRVFSDRDRALAWLSRPRRRFANRTSLEMLRTETGGLLVDEMLFQIEYGIFA